MTVSTFFRPMTSEGKDMENTSVEWLHSVLSEIVERTGELCGSDTVEIVDQWFARRGTPLPKGDL